MGYFETANSWYKKAKQEKNVYSKFISLYIALNALYAHETGIEADRPAIRSWCESRTPSSKFLRELFKGRDVKFFAMRQPPGFDEHIPILDSRTQDRPRTRRGNLRKHNLVREAYLNGKPTKIHYVELMDVIYQVRCNLFHGNKTEYFPENRRVVSHSGNILGLLLAPILEK